MGKEALFSPIVLLARHVIADTDNCVLLLPSSNYEGSTSVPFVSRHTLARRTQHVGRQSCGLHVTHRHRDVFLSVLVIHLKAPYSAYFQIFIAGHRLRWRTVT